MLSSPTKPESRYFYDVLTRGAQDGDGGMPLLAFNREIDLPQIAGHHCVGSSQGFLITVDRNAEIHATNPITGAHLTLPSTVNLPNMIGVVRNPATRDIEHYVSSRPHEGKRRTGERQVRPFSHFFYEDKRRKDSRLIHELKPGFQLFDIEFMRFSCYNRVIISPGLDFAAVIILLGECPGIPAFARLGQDTSWTALPPPDVSIYDIIFRDGCLYIINIFGKVAIFDMDNPSSPSFLSPEGAGPLEVDYLRRPSLLGDPPEIDYVSPPRSPGGPLETRPRFLVRSLEGDDLFLLKREIGFCHSKTKLRTKTFTVYKLDWSNLTWRRVTSIADYALFVGTNDSVALSVRDFPSIKPNSIYFTDCYTMRDLKCHVGVFNLEDGSVHPLSYSFKKFNWPPPIWFMPGML